MAQCARVSCVNRSDRSGIHQRIKSIGGRNGDGSGWKLLEWEAIAGIERGEWSFEVERPAGDTVEVVVAMRLGIKYLKTAADEAQPDNLLALPECL